MDREGFGGDAMDDVARLQLGLAKDLGLGLADQLASQGQEVVSGRFLKLEEQPLRFGFLLDCQGGRSHGDSHKRGAITQATKL